MGVSLTPVSPFLFPSLLTFHLGVWTGGVGGLGGKELKLMIRACVPTLPILFPLLASELNSTISSPACLHCLMARPFYLAGREYEGMQLLPPTNTNNGEGRGHRIAELTSSERYRGVRDSAGLGSQTNSKEARYNM